MSACGWTAGKVATGDGRENHMCRNKARTVIQCSNERSATARAKGYEATLGLTHVHGPDTAGTCSIPLDMIVANLCDKGFAILVVRSASKDNEENGHGNERAHCRLT